MGVQNEANRELAVLPHVPNLTSGCNAVKINTKFRWKKFRRFMPVISAVFADTLQNMIIYLTLRQTQTIQSSYNS